MWQCSLGNRSARSQKLGRMTTIKPHEYLLNKSCEFTSLRQDSSLWCLALALWFLLGNAEYKTFSATGMGLASQWLLCARLSYLGKTERLSGAAKNSKTTRLQMLSLFCKFLRFTKCRFKVESPLELMPKHIPLKRCRIQVSEFAKTS